MFEFFAAEMGNVLEKKEVETVAFTVGSSAPKGEVILNRIQIKKSNNVVE